MTQNKISIRLDEDIKPILERVSFIISEDLVETQPWVDGDLDSIFGALNTIDNLLSKARAGLLIIEHSERWLNDNKKNVS